MTNSRKSAGTKFSPLLLIGGALGIVFTIYISYRASISNKTLFPISLIALFAGLLFEGLRIAGDLKKVSKIFALTYILSLFSFLPGRDEEQYIIEKHISIWPYLFIFIFAILFVSSYKEKVTAKLTEGATLLLSISLIYWAIDYGFINNHSAFSISLIIIGSIFSIFSFINALSYIHLSRTIRLALSIWSTIIMFAFAVDNIIRVFRNSDIESAYLSVGLYISLQYFLLGVSAVYILQNYILLAAFIPRRSKNYKKNLIENKKDHIDRFSDEQVNIGQSLFCIVFTGTVYWLNHKFQLLPRHTMIWLVLIIFPILLNLTQSVNIKNNSNN